MKANFEDATDGQIQIKLKATTDEEKMLLSRFVIDMGANLKPFMVDPGTTSVVTMTPKAVV